MYLALIHGDIESRSVTCGADCEKLGIETVVPNGRDISRVDLTITLDI
jgi:hypothetical protein